MRTSAKARDSIEKMLAAMDSFMVGCCMSSGGEEGDCFEFEEMFFESALH